MSVLFGSKVIRDLVEGKPDYELMDESTSWYLCRREFVDKGPTRHLRWRKHLDHGARRHLYWWHRMDASPRRNLLGRQQQDYGTCRNLHRRGLKVSTIKRETTAHCPCNSELNERLGARMSPIRKLKHKRYSHALVKRLLFNIRENSASKSCYAQATSLETKLGSIDVRYPIPYMQLPP